MTVEFHEDETFSSFVSRLAAANSAPSAQVFCQHMGVRLQSLVDGEPEVVSRLLSLSRQQHKAQAAGVGSRDERTFQFGNETLLRSSLSRSRLRVSPQCLDQDESTGSGPTGTRTYGRLTWLPSFVRTCAEHGALLTSLPDPVAFGSPHDFAARVRLARPGWDEFRRRSSLATASDQSSTSAGGYSGAGNRRSGWIDFYCMSPAG
ncbi:TniQ family protein [Rhizobium ruizarguesonis]